MNFAHAYKYIIGTLLIVVCLALPAANIAYAAATLDSDKLLMPDAYSTTTTAPCDNCPCSDGQDSECCDSSFCSCSFHVPLSRGLQLRYAPVIVTQNFREQNWTLPQIFFSIFVPPQNPA